MQQFEDQAHALLQQYYNTLSIRKVMTLIRQTPNLSKHLNLNNPKPNVYYPSLGVDLATIIYLDNYKHSQTSSR